MMMTTNNTSGTFGIIPSSNNPAFGQVRQPLVVPRKATTTLDAPNAFTGQVVGQKPSVLPPAFNKMTPPAEDPLKLGAFFQATGIPRQVTGIGNTPAFKFASTEGQVIADAKGGVGNMNREQAKKQAGVASDDVVSGSGATHTG